MILPLLLLAGCSGVQSALDPAGQEARVVARLFWVMLLAGTAIWLAMMALAFHAARRRAQPWSERGAVRLILWGGAVVPTLILAALLVFGLGLMPTLRAPGQGLRIEVQGEQFWWRVRYALPDGRSLTTANEIRLPRGQRSEFLLTAQDVIHSFWIPVLGGKMDMIPGATNRLVLEPEKTGLFRGVCAEFCGSSHALMAFSVEVMEPEAFEAWLAAEMAPAATPRGEGAALFLARGCGACHTVRGTAAAGRIGPDLTHLAGRHSLGAGILPNDAATIDRFIREVDRIKPSARMPGFAMLPPAETAAIAGWLGSLR
ncbi:cytochrome c oxidase subunit II [Roseomonas sp. 18066]|uniref:cytochrome c oxidase subunit II n=1 Tax=Roseomonas sp. 18066 TaxID=2681412 RepID=UPI00135B2EAF|nr:cytochrome c oxidase subunit II [Roseomonas sp. 18066]